MIAKETRFERDGLSVVIRPAGPGCVIRWTGSSDAKNPQEFIQPIVDYVVEQMKHGSVTIDFTGLAFMNSSTVSPIIGMLKSLNANSIATRVEFSSADWQQTHMRCLKTISRVLEHVTVVGRPT
jgi:anti-anti-sigma regulatory factor